MTDFLSSLSKWLSEKTNSPLYWTYFGSFLFWNWKFFQVTLLEDASVFASPRVEYIDGLLFTPFGITFLDWICNIIIATLPPAIFTYIAIVYLPRLNKWAFDIYLTHYFDRKSLFQERKVAYENKMASLLTQEVAAKKSRVRQKKEIEKVKTEEEKWQDEFEQVKRPDLLQGFQRFVGILYRKGGIMYGSDIEHHLSNAHAVMAFAGTHDLINTEKRDGSPLVQLTEKGKYFSRLLADKGIIAQ